MCIYEAALKTGIVLLLVLAIISAEFKNNVFYAIYYLLFSFFGLTVLIFFGDSFEEEAQNDECK